MREIKFKRAHFADDEKKEFIEYTNWGVDINRASFLSPTNMAISNSHIDYQFTGLKDKNGKEIFAGDIVEHKVRSYKVGETSKTINSVVFWDVKKAGFYIASVNMIEYYLTGKNGYSKGYHLNAKDKTIIGNIHENKELVK